MDEMCTPIESITTHDSKVLQPPSYSELMNNVNQEQQPQQRQMPQQMPQQRQMPQQMPQQRQMPQQMPQQRQMPQQQPQQRQMPQQMPQQRQMPQQMNMLPQQMNLLPQNQVFAPSVQHHNKVSVSQKDIVVIFSICLILGSSQFKEQLLKMLPGLKSDVLYTLTNAFMISVSFYFISRLDINIMKKD